MAENTNLQQEIAAIEEELRKKRAVLEQQQVSGEISELPEEKETLHEIVGEQIESVQPSTEQPANIQPPPQPKAPVSPDTPAYLSEELKPQVQELIDLAFNKLKSIYGAIKIAKGKDNNALVDAFHDALVDELFDMLVEQKMVKKL